MTKKMKFAAGLIAAVALMSSCSITTPLAATSNPIGKKVGTAKATIVFGLCFGGNHGVEAAAKNGGITKVSTVDVRYFNVLYIFQTNKTIVTGE